MNRRHRRGYSYCAAWCTSSPACPSLQIHTPFVNAVVEGTELVLRVGEAETELIVFEGRVRFENAAGGLVVASREAALARAGEVPVRRVLVKPREAVEWALYYPPAH